MITVQLELMEVSDVKIMSSQRRSTPHIQTVSHKNRCIGLPYMSALCTQHFVHVNKDSVAINLVKDPPAGSFTTASSAAFVGHI